MRYGLVAVLALGFAGCTKKPPESAATGAPAPAPTAVETAPVADGSASEPAPAATPAAPAAPKHDTSKRIADALALLDQNQPNTAERALAILGDVVAADPDNAFAHLNQGVAFHQLGRDSQAKSAFRKAVSIDPTLGAGWLYLGAMEERNGSVAGALDNYRQGVRSDPENLDLRVALIGALRAIGRPEEAIEEAKKALRINANSLAVYNNMGLAYLDRGNLELARFVFEKALNSIPDADKNAYIQANLGWTLYRQDEKGPAIFHLRKAVELDPELVPALVYLARLYMDDRNYADMVPLLETAQKKQPQNHGVLMNLGIAYRGVGRFDDAKKTYQKAVAVEPGNPDPWFNIGILEGDYFKNYDAAVVAFEKYIEAGGAQAELAREYVKEVKKEKKRAEKLKKAEEDRKRREAELAERKRLLEEAEKQQQQQPEAPPQPEGGEGASQPEGQQAPPTEGQQAPPEAETPWGAEAPPAEEPPAEEPPAEDGGGTTENPWGEQ